MVAADLQMDPVALRLKNLVQPGRCPIPGADAPGMPPMVFDSGNYPMALQRALDEIDYGPRSNPAGCVQRGQVPRHCMGCFVKWTGLGPMKGARVSSTVPSKYCSVSWHCHYGARA